MVFCYRCGKENPDNSNYCNGCGAFITTTRKFEDTVKQFADEIAKVGKEMGEKAAEIGKKMAKDAVAFADEVSTKMSPKTLDCPKCGTAIYETDAFCWKCGEKRG